MRGGEEGEGLKPLNILHVIGGLAPRYGGPSKVCFEMARAVARLGHHVQIYTTDIDGPGRLNVNTSGPMLKEGVTIRYFRVAPPRFWRFAPGLAGALRREIPRVDVVHIHSLYFFTTVVAGYYCRKYGVPYIIRPHDTLAEFQFRRHRLRKYPFEILSERRNLRCAGAVQFTSRGEFRRSRPHMFGGRGVVIPNGINSEEYIALPPAGRFRRRYPEMSGKRIILFLGRISYKKGIDILLEALAGIVHGRPALHLAIVGPDDEGLARGLKEKADRLGLAGRVTFTGMLLGKEKLAAFRDSELFVLPSHSENFGVAAVEAMACKMPVLLSNRVEIWREVVKAGAGASSKLDPKALADRLAFLIDRPATLRKMGRRGRKLVRRQYDWKLIANRLVGLYANLSGRRLRGKGPEQ